MYGMCAEVEGELIESGLGVRKGWKEGLKHDACEVKGVWLGRNDE